MEDSSVYRELMAKIANPRKGWSKEDHYAEQLWDSDCNTCKHIRRIPFDRNVERPHLFGTPAHCNLFDRSVRCYGPGIFSAHPCFVHIRTGELSPHEEGTAIEERRFTDGGPWFPVTNNGV